ncbi:hypothetical protein ACFWF9_27320 [Streptomyces roseolus]|uniref:hypothetical protein n=1 Tax=Streptomyces roseolus TaxID=67358 RepID=UPI0036551F6B
MAPTGSDRPGTDFPRGVGAPATRVLAATGYTRLDQQAGVPAAELAALHGMGPRPCGCSPRPWPSAAPPSADLGCTAPGRAF